MSSLLLLLARSIMLVGFITAAVWSVRIGCADYWLRRETVRGTKTAIALTPGRSDLYARLASLESDDDEQRATEALERAIVLNPSDASSWIELGLRNEAAGNSRAAEHYLLRSAQEDKGFLPRWTLANYYLRRNDAANFWIWVKKSEPVLTGDPALLFQLCGRVSEDGRLIDRLQISRADVRASYLSYLMDLNRFDLLNQPAHSVLKENRASDVPLLLRACDRLLQAKRLDESIEIWNRLAEVHRIPFGALLQTKVAAITNGDFAVQPISQGFDWRLPSLTGVSVSTEENPAGLRFAFSGSEAESCESLIQFVPVHENTEYGLVFSYRTAGIPSGAGPRWRIADGDGAVLKEGLPLSSVTEAQGRISLRTPKGCHLLRLSLSYERVPGTTRIEGLVMLRRVVLQGS